MNTKEHYLNNVGIYNVFQSNFEKYPNKVVINVNDKNLLYHELVSKGKKVAASLYYMGVRKGDRVAIVIPNSVNWYIFLYGILKLGAIPVPFDPQLAKYEIQYLFDKIGVRVVLIPDSYRNLNHMDILNELRLMLPDLKKVIVDSDKTEEDEFFCTFNSLLNGNEKDIENYSLQMTREDSNIFFSTTGSTGNPKIVDIPARVFEDNVIANASAWGFVDGDRFLLSMPLFHCAGFGWGISCLSAGGSIYYEDKFLPSSFLETISREKITTILVTPTIAKILLTHPKFNDFDLSSLKQIVFTGEYLSDDLAAKFRDKMGLRVFNALGMTETFVYLHWDSQRDVGISPSKLNYIPGIDIKVVKPDGSSVKIGEKGLIYIRNSVMKGYFRLPDVTKQTIDEDGWLNSGDLAILTKDNFIQFCGREKRVIKRGGNLVAPEEIEQFLKTHEFCNAVVVDKEEDEIFGEKIVAYVESVVGKKLTKNDLMKFCKGNISSYKIPDEFVIVKEIPKTVGKVNPTLLKKALIAGELELVKN